MIKNTSDEDLKMYVVSEPTPQNFVPGKEMLVTDERQVPVRTPMAASPYTIHGASGHWAHIVRDLFSKTDGLATIGDIITVTIDPLTMGEPHPHNPGQEEIWAAIDGNSLAFIGSELRVQHPGMAYMIRPDHSMTHSNINSGDTPVKFLWFSGIRRSRSKVREPREADASSAQRAKLHSFATTANNIETRFDGQMRTSAYVYEVLCIE